MVSKPKPSKYGCGTTITWDEQNRLFKGPDGQKHDCRDWDKSTFPPAAQQTTQQSFNNPAGGGVYQSAAPPPTGETLIGVQAKKTWENYFKFLEVIAANTAAITSSLDATNKLLVELGTKLQSMEDTMTVTKAKVEPENEA
jgi:hypothetical protein